MTYPLGVITRTINVGDSLTVESGTDLTVRATLRSSRGLVWVATGERAVSVPEVRESATAGDAVTFTPPVTDQSGWRDLATGALIDVSVPGSHTHTYTIELVVLLAGQPVDRRFIGPFALPTGDGSPVDANLLVEADTVPGLLVPDALTPRMDALESEMSDLGGSIGGAVADYLTANPPSGSPDATTLTKGIVKLAGDLGGTANAPTVPGLADKADADHTHTLADITDYTAPPPPPDLSGYATTTAVASALAGKADDGHGHTIAQVTGLQSALDGKQPAGSYAPALGPDDNYVTDAEKVKLHTHPAVIAQGATAAAARAAIGAGTSSFSGAYADLSGKPTLGTAAATDAGDYATAAQIEAIAASIPAEVEDYLTANPPTAVVDHGTLAGLADDDHLQYHTDARGDARYSPLGHGHTMADVTDYSPPDLSGYVTNAALTSGLSDKADMGHGHAINDVFGLQSALDGKQPAGSYAPVAHSHAEYAAAEHRHDAADIDNLPSAPDLSGFATVDALAAVEAAIPSLDGLVAGDDPRLSDTRTPTAHGHSLGDVSGLQSALDGKQPTGDYITTTDPRLTDARTPLAHQHSSTQITDWAEAVQDTVAAMLTSGANVTLSYDDASGKITITAAGGDAEVMRDTIGAALVGVNGVSVVVNDAADTITLSITGLTIAQVSGLQTALDGKQPAGSYAPATHNHDDRYYTEAETDTLLSGKAATGHTHGELHTHTNAAALALVSGTNTGDQDLSGYATIGHNHAGIYAPALGPDDNYVTDAEKVKLGNLSGTNTGDQTLPTWSTLSGKPAVIGAGATAADARTAIGAGTSDLTLGSTASTAKAGNYSPPAASATMQGIVELATIAETTTGTDTTRAVTPAGVKAVADTKAPVSHTHAYADLTGKPTLGTAAATASTDYATAAQGAKADTALQPATPQPINAKTAAYTLVASDAGKLVTMTLSAAAGLTVPSGVFAAGQRVDVLDLGVGRVTFVAGAGMTLSGTPSLVSRAQYSAHSIVFLSAAKAVVVGDLA